MFSSEKVFHKCMPYIVAASYLLAIGLLVYVFTLSPEGVDPHNLASGKKNAATLFGCTLGLIPVYILDRKFINFQTEGKWYAQIIKLVLGFAGVLLIKAGLSSPLLALFGNEYVARGVRYFLIVMFAGSVWPLTFKYFAKLRIAFLDNLFKKEK